MLLVYFDLGWENTDLISSLLILGFINENASGFKRPNAIIFQRQPTSSSHGMGRASDPSKLDTQSLIVGPVSTPTPSIDAGRETPAVSYR